MQEGREGPLQLYREKVRAGELAPDPIQELAAEKLQSLNNALRHYRPSPDRASWKERLGLGQRLRADPPQGLYIYGGVGRGKSMLMDLFFACAPVERKRRVHFHAFMNEVHERLHSWRRRTKGSKTDPLPELGQEIAEETWLLCFDEFHVINIADAMILGRLFEKLFEEGVVMVATSNWPPDELYEGGLQRDRFLPFIALFKERLDILHLTAARDYRLARVQDIEVYHTPLGPKSDQALSNAFARLTEGAMPDAERIEVKGRTLDVRAAARGVARFSFHELCVSALGASDYLAIARRYHTVVLEGIPRLSEGKRDQARRFMTLVDALYEHRVKLVVSAETLPEKLYLLGDGAKEFQRTISRLQEMRSRDYRALDHLPE